MFLWLPTYTLCELTGHEDLSTAHWGGCCAGLQCWRSDERYTRVCLTVTMELAPTSAQSSRPLEAKPCETAGATYSSRSQKRMHMQHWS